MTKIRIIAIVILSMIAFSCVSNDHMSQNDQYQHATERQIVLQTFTDYTSLCKTEDIDVNKHADFVTPELISRIQQSTRVKSVDGPVSASAELALIDSPDQLPIVREIASEETIYADGSMVSTITDYLNPLFNPIFEMYETPVDMKQYVCRVDYADGVMKSYNREGTLLLSKPYQMPDMREYIAVLDEIIAELEAEIEKAGGSITDINAVRSKFPTDSAANYSIEENESGNMVIEEILNDANTRTLGESRPLRVRTEVTPDMKRTLLNTQTRGDQLILRTRYRYAEKNTKYKNKVAGSEFSTENPQTVTTERLVFDDYGYPRIETTQEHYSRNEMIYHKEHK